MTTPAADYGLAGDDKERQKLGEILSQVFNFAAADSPSWLAYAGHENVRVIRRAGEVIGGLVQIPMGQFWHGRSVPLIGYAGVGVEAHHRGRGEATRMMQQALVEARGQGYPMAGLYPATQPLYRKVGFEQAGGRYELRGPITALPKGSREPSVRPVGPADLEPMKRLYSEMAKTRPGYLDRGNYVWHRVQNPRGRTAVGYVIGEGENLEGYLFMSRVAVDAFRQDLVLSDFVVRSVAGYRRALAFLADHGSLVREVSWYSSAEDPLLLLLEEQRFTVKAYDSWMLRVLDVEKALGSRGYLSGMSGSLALEIDDDLFPENCGRFQLQVENGKGQVKRGGEGSLRCPIRTLPALYSGHRSATELARIGALSGTEEAIARADALFAGRAPAMSDQF